MTGEIGMGKSHVLRHVCDNFREKCPSVWGCGDPFEDSRNYMWRQVFRCLFHGAFHWPESSKPASVRALEATLPDEKLEERMFASFVAAEYPELLHKLHFANVLFGMICLVGWHCICALDWMSMVLLFFYICV